MASYAYGFHYDRPKKGEGQSIEWENGCIACLTKKSALAINKQLINMGHGKASIVIESN